MLLPQTDYLSWTNTDGAADAICKEEEGQSNKNYCVDSMNDNSESLRNNCDAPYQRNSNLENEGSDDEEFDNAIDVSSMCEVNIGFSDDVRLPSVSTESTTASSEQKDTTLINTRLDNDTALCEKDIARNDETDVMTAMLKNIDDISSNAADCGNDEVDRTDVGDCGMNGSGVTDDVADSAAVGNGDAVDRTDAADCVMNSSGATDDVTDPAGVGDGDTVDRTDVGDCVMNNSGATDDVVDSAAVRYGDLT